MGYKTREQANDYTREWRKTHPLSDEARYKDNARSKLSVYIKRGKIVKPDGCSICGFPSGIEGHHHKGYDGENALDVVWLCKNCHVSVHISQ